MSAADEVLRYLGKWDAEYLEVHAALQRPQCRWPLNYESGAEMSPGHLIPLTGFTNLMRLRLMALAAKGDGEAYTQCLLNMMKIERTIGARPESWLAQLVSSTISTITLNTWQQTLACVHLNEQQLKSLQEQVSRYSVESVRLALQNERVIGIDTFRKLSGAKMVDWMDKLDWTPSARWEATAEIEHGLFRLGMLLRPEGWTFAEAALGQDFSLNEESPCVDSIRGVIHAAKVESTKLKAEQLKDSLSWFSMGRHAQNLDTFSTLIERTARVHSQARKAILWCAVERYRLRYGQLPASTGDLVPEFLATLPVDVLDGGAIRFTPHETGGYVLHSSGWSAGHIRERSNGAPAKEDWTWPSNPTLLETESDGEPNSGLTTGPKK